MFLSCFAESIYGGLSYWTASRNDPNMLLLILKPLQSLSKGKLDTQVSCQFVHVRLAFSNAFNKQWYENAVLAAHTPHTV